ncbi:MAG TPA: pitrilysin family protein [Thermoanaerobaculia bacterium]|jgi:predicted Zn-dependent peptidase|nr:pitrilysin family protein [Thermoanaerobaculia bacterium]
MRAVHSRLTSLAVLLMLVAAGASAQDLASFEKRTSMRQLDNGLTVIILERHDAPVFTYATMVNTGSAQEVPGITGLAHMFEHMAFKGSDRIGTTNWDAERAALAKVEETYAVYDQARRAETGRDEAKVQQLEKVWKDAIAEADKHAKGDEFSEVVDRAGGVGMNAFTSSDQTGYFFSLPSNRFELWAFLESERFRQPVFRQFYKERDVVTEERRMRTESSPFGRLLEQYLATAFIAHPYGFATVGWPSDLQSFSATDALAFAKKHYVPSNMVIAIVGDVNPTEAWPVIEKYFGRLPKAPKPDTLRTVEPKQIAERMVILREASQPLYVEGYHRPAATHPDSAVYDVISMLTSSGRTSRLYRALVRDKKIAAAAAGFNGFPGEKYPSMFTFYGVTTPGHTPDEIAAAMQIEIERLKTEDVPADELQSVKTRVKAQLVRGLADNDDLALAMASYQTLYGDWRELFREVERIDKVTAADVKRVAAETFTQSNRTVAKIESAPKPAPKGGAQ